MRHFFVACPHREYSLAKNTVPTTVKCSRDVPNCEFCRQHSQECVYTRVVRTPLTRKNLDAAEQRIRRLEALLAKQQEEEEEHPGIRQQSIFDLSERSTRDEASRPPADPRLDSHDPTLSLATAGPSRTFSPQQTSLSLSQGAAHSDGGTCHPDPPLFSPPAPVSLAPPVFHPAAPTLPAAPSDSTFPLLTTPVVPPAPSLDRLSHDLAARLELPPASTSSSAETPVETEEDGMGSLTVEQGPHASSYLGESRLQPGPQQFPQSLITHPTQALSLEPACCASCSAALPMLILLREQR